MLFQVSAKLRNVRGRPGEMICQIASEEKSVLVVVGSRGMGSFRRTILGSVSDYISKHCQCPVIVCRESVDVDNPARNRHCSDTRTRTPSGELTTSITSQIRRRFASGNRTVASCSPHLPIEVRNEMAKLEKRVVLFG